jgi:hypothetical protein
MRGTRNDVVRVQGSAPHLDAASAAGAATRRVRDEASL